MYDSVQLNEICRLARHNIITSTTKAQSGHPTSSLSAVELMVGLFGSGIFRYKISEPKYINNDKLIFSKGHASPLYYSLWSLANGLDSKELNDFRKFGSRLEGHPTLKFPHTIASTGSLGQGLSIGVGLAINARYIDKIDYKTYVLIGDGELAEGSVWEAVDSASKYNLDNLIAVVDVNRLDQVGETIHGWDIEKIGQKFESFGWEVLLLPDGHDINAVTQSYEAANNVKDRPIVIIAKTIKGKGYKNWENKEGWHGKALSVDQSLDALDEIGDVNEALNIELPMPEVIDPTTDSVQKPKYTNYEIGDEVEVRDGYGNGLLNLVESDPDVVVLDAGMENSTRSIRVREKYPGRFFEMNIAEQNMVGVAIGLEKAGKKPIISTFGAFFTRAYDQIRMAQYSDVNITFSGSHSGVSIGKDGSSQMGLEDISMFRSIKDSIVLYPSDAVSMEKSIELAANHKGISYIRSTRAQLPIIYRNEDEFKIGKSRTVYSSDEDLVTIISGGVTLKEAIKAYEILKKEGIMTRVIDVFSIKPLDLSILLLASKETGAILTVEDHYLYGGIGEAVASKLSTVNIPVYKMAVSEIPMSGKPEKLIEYEEIDSNSIVEHVKDIVDET